ncbi:acrylyl-CoA reductase (NADPH) [Enterococcus sp. PF1-24]|uniref:YhdH/YhfP family quinone oxidoreductase n=1 Tax=unclassified Enterococcus TaxID=2608891 RepID=UPI0024731EE0|nr:MULTISPECIES: YhdH/YhfP family quinone oxidoreductase [unclassified Enterococcus]MDH6363289.1 acrylyl-CoA reductase (NADPH) [Enterococcus sp. PFB1-1]MDH6400410.1 acrylyl-CoA reductase (NADPH) [Enterococcus sp. PF1-24]
MSSFQALMVTNENQFQRTYKSLTNNDLPDGDVTIQIAYSGVNFKDALASIEKGGVIRNYPMTPGIDASGTVIDSQHPNFQVGDEVIVTSYGFGVTHPGGYSEIQRIPAEWIVPLPAGLSLKAAMVLGTAGFTAALAVAAIEEAGLTTDSRIVITGASGGVGSMALAMLHKLGYQNLTAVTRKSSAHSWLTALGAAEIVTPEALIPEKLKALAKQEYDFAIDTVGGKLAEALIPSLQYGGSMALCGNASGIQLQTTVLPFILRGVNLLGIDSVNTPMNKRKAIWHRLATDLNVTENLKVNEVGFNELPIVFDSLLTGTHEGRSIVKIGGK